MTTIKPPIIQIREYHAILNQSGTNNPTARILHNTLIGDIEWTREDIGLYTGTLTGGLPAGKTGITLNSGDQQAIMSSAENSDNNTLFIICYDTSTNTRINGLYEAYVIVRVYNI